jgi:hypothetical protein
MYMKMYSVASRDRVRAVAIAAAGPGAKTDAWMS